MVMWGSKISWSASIMLYNSDDGVMVLAGVACFFLGGVGSKGYYVRIPNVRLGTKNKCTYIN